MADSPNGDSNARGTQEHGGNLADKAKGPPASTMERARDVASHAAHKAMDLGRYAAGVAGNATAKVGHRIESMGGTLRDSGPHEGMMGTAASTVANALERGGRYLQEEGLSGFADDLTRLIRRKLNAVRSEIHADLHKVIKQQLALLKAELKQDLRRSRGDLVSLVFARNLLILGGVLLCFTAVHLLEWAFRPHLELWACHLIVGSVVAGIGAILFSAARRHIHKNWTEPQS
jgi:hypothetical protein